MGNAALAIDDREEEWVIESAIDRQMANRCGGVPISQAQRERVAVIARVLMAEDPALDLSTAVVRAFWQYTGRLKKDRLKRSDALAHGHYQPAGCRGGCGGGPKRGTHKPRLADVRAEQDRQRAQRLKRGVRR